MTAAEVVYDGDKVKIPNWATQTYGQPNQLVGTELEKLVELTGRVWLERFGSSTEMPSFSHTCPTCGGLATVIHNDSGPQSASPCMTCDGKKIIQGVHEELLDLKLFIPHGHAYFTIKVGLDPSIWIGIPECSAVKISPLGDHWRFTFNLSHALEWPSSVVSIPRVNQKPFDELVLKWGEVLAAVVKEKLPRYYTGGPEDPNQVPWFEFCEPSRPEEMFITVYSPSFTMKFMTLNLVDWKRLLKGEGRWFQSSHYLDVGDIGKALLTSRYGWYFRS